MLCLSKVLLILCESCSETSSLASFVFLGLSLFADFLSASRSFLFTLCVFLSFTCTKLCSGEIHLYILTAGLRVQTELHNLTHAHTRTDTHTRTHSNPICHSTLLRNKVCLAVTLLVALYPLSCVDTYAHTHTRACTNTHTISQVLNYNAANTEKHVWLGSFTSIFGPVLMLT